MKDPATGIDADEEYLIALHCARLMNQVANFENGWACWSNMSGWPAYSIHHEPGADYWVCQYQEAAFMAYSSRRIPLNQPAPLAKFLLTLPNFNTRTHVSKLTEWAARTFMS